MCDFKSAIVLHDESVKDGFQIKLSPWTEHHSELCTIFKLKDSGHHLKFARIEYSPSSMDKAYLLDEYKLKIDEERCPDWLDDEMKEKVAAKMRAYIKSIIVDGDIELLIGGQFILSPNANVESANCVVINAMCGGTLTEMCGGTLTNMWGGTLKEMWGGTLTKMWGGMCSLRFGRAEFQSVRLGVDPVHPFFPCNPSGFVKLYRNDETKTLYPSRSVNSQGRPT